MSAFPPSGGVVDTIGKGVHYVVSIDRIEASLFMVVSNSLTAFCLKIGHIVMNYFMLIYL